MRGQQIKYAANDARVALKNYISGMRRVIDADRKSAEGFKASSILIAASGLFVRMVMCSGRSGVFTATCNIFHG